MCSGIIMVAVISMVNNEASSLGGQLAQLEVKLLLLILLNIWIRPFLLKVPTSAFTLKKRFQQIEGQIRKQAKCRALDIRH